MEYMGKRKMHKGKKGGFFNRFWAAQIFILYYTKFIVRESNSFFSGKRMEALRGYFSYFTEIALFIRYLLILRISNLRWVLVLFATSELQFKARRGLPSFSLCLRVLYWSSKVFDSSSSLVPRSVFLIGYPTCPHFLMGMNRIVFLSDAIRGSFSILKVSFLSTDADELAL